MKGLRSLTPALGLSRGRLVLLCQLLATAATLGWVPGNPAKLMTMLVIWGLGFGRIRAAELLAMGAVNLLFVLMNSAALKRGIFGFDHPDFLGMPVYEYLMWGFYTLHTIRFLDGEGPRGGLIPVLAAAAAFALPFALIADPALLLAASAVVLAGCIVMFHEPMDLAYAGYMAALGALIEYVGVGDRAMALSRQALRRRAAVVSDDVGRGRLVYAAPDPAAAAAVAEGEPEHEIRLRLSRCSCRRNVVEAGCRSANLISHVPRRLPGIRRPVSVMISPSSGWQSLMLAMRWVSTAQPGCRSP